MTSNKTHDGFLMDIDHYNTIFPSEQIKLKMGERCNNIDTNLVFECANGHPDFVTSPRYLTTTRVGCPNCGLTKPVHSPEIIKTQQQTVAHSGGVEFSMDNPIIREKVKQMMLDRYKRTNPSGAFWVDSGGADTSTHQHVSLDNLKKLLNKDWLIDQHHTQSKPLAQIGHEVGCTISTVYRYCVYNGVEVQYYFESTQQKELSEWLRSLGIEVDTNRCDITTGQLDIYLPQYSLAIEYCGIFWHSDAQNNITPNYHKNKLKHCEQLNIRLLTIFEDEWLYKKNIVKQKILSILKMNKESVYARKCRVIHIKDSKTKREFLDANHIQGSGPGSITYGLVLDDKIVAMMTFIKKPGGVFDLNRYATSVRVVGGFQKLLKHFQKHHEWNEILSFADLRWSQGDMYNKNGFDLDKILPPDYRYVIGNQTHHKFQYRRQHLKTFLSNFDPLLSEVQNMRNAGYYRIFNCGLMRFVLRSS